VFVSINSPPTAQNNIYIRGYFSGTVNFDGVPNSSSIYGKGVILKLDASEEVIWIKYFRDEGHISSSDSDISIDHTGNIYISRSF